LQQVYRLEGEEPWEVGELFRGELPAHRRPDQLAVGERVEERDAQAGWDDETGGRSAAVDERRQQFMEVIAQGARALQGPLGGPRVRRCCGQQVSC
jgi:hypothetical protein